MQSAFHICAFYIRGFSQLRIENIWKKQIPERSKKQNLNLPGNSLHSIYIVFTTSYIAFTLY